MFSLKKNNIQHFFKSRGFQDEWFNKNVYWSLDACDSNKKIETGNDQFLPNTRLISKDLTPEYGGGGLNTTTSPEGCQTECYVRYDEHEIICYIHWFSFFRNNTYMIC